MVAATAQRSAYGGVSTLPPSVVAGRGGVVRFTVDDALAMVRGGIIHEDATTELFGGIIVYKDRAERGGDPAKHGLRHCQCVRRLTAVVGRIDRHDRHVQVQLPLVCGPDQMPEPDFAIIRGRDEDYAGRLPTATDAYCIIEVADSSLERDEAEKLPVYAAAGVPQYVIINLRTDTAQIYLNPDPAAGTYQPPTVARRGDTISLNAGPGGPVAVALNDVLP